MSTPAPAPTCRGEGSCSGERSPGDSDAARRLLADALGMATDQGYGTVARRVTTILESLDSTDPF